MDIMILKQLCLFFISTKDPFCADDSHLRYYNRIVATSNIKKDYKSFEQMRRDDKLYEVVVTVGYNRANQPNRGSCIFLHIANSNKPTAGYAAMKRSYILELIKWLEPNKHPFISISD